jgi:prepilin-type N-terminal cleavage/methylation domain-containing protein
MLWWRITDMALSSKKISKQQGFSLLEMVMVIVLLSIVAAIGSSMLSSGFTAYFTGRDIINADWQGRFALDRMTRELRMVRSATVADLDILTANAITFTDTAGNVVSYSRAGNTLMRNAQPLADGVSALSFSYIEADGKTATTDATVVAYVTVDLAVNQAGSSFTLRNTIDPRNF